MAGSYIAIKRGTISMSYHRRNKLRGVHPGEVPIVVRWLGAYGHHSDVKEMAEWELQPDRWVAAEALRKGKSYIHCSLVGLLVDTDKTTLIRAYRGDSYTDVTKAKKLKASRNRDFVTRWEHVYAVNRRLNGKGGPYVECTIANPIYKAIVCKSDKKSAIGFAQKLSDLMGLPVEVCPDMMGEEKYQFEHQKEHKPKPKPKELTVLLAYNTHLCLVTFQGNVFNPDSLKYRPVNEYVSANIEVVKPKHEKKPVFWFNRSFNRDYKKEAFRKAFLANKCWKFARKILRIET
jgi:hypothetical protein